MRLLGGTPHIQLQKSGKNIQAGVKFHSIFYAHNDDHDHEATISKTAVVTTTEHGATSTLLQLADPRCGRPLGLNIRSCGFIS